jgi:hypothetical protein
VEFRFQFVPVGDYNINDCMKTIGLISGMGWESTAEYYRLNASGIKRQSSKVE